MHEYMKTLDETNAMNYKNIKDIVESALECTLRHGAENARITYSKGSQTSFSVLGTELDRLHRATSSSMFIQIFTDGKYGEFSTNQLEGKEVDSFIRRSIEITRLIEEDRDRTLPPAGLYFRDDGTRPDLKQYDAKIDTISVEDKKQLAFAPVKEISGTDKRLVYMASEYNDSEDYMFMADTQGFRGEAFQTSFSLSCECAVKGKSDARPEAWWYESSIFYDDLMKEGCGKNALKRALDRMNPKKIKSGKYCTVIEDRVASRIVSPIISAMNGASIHQKNSFLIDKIGEEVFPKNMNLIDRPFEIGTPGARYFDGEGIATSEMDIIRNGRLNTYYISPYYSRKLGMEPTVEGPSVLKFEKSSGMMNDHASENAASMIKSIGKGIFITGFNGGNCNGSTGDFSFGIEGFYFENGEIIHPIKEMNLTGNILTFWKGLKYIGNDYRRERRWHIPSLAFENAEFSGK